jgi:hypothetical protein
MVERPIDRGRDRRGGRDVGLAQIAEGGSYEIKVGEHDQPCGSDSELRHVRSKFAQAVGRHQLVMQQLRARVGGFYRTLAVGRRAHGERVCGGGHPAAGDRSGQAFEARSYFDRVVFELAQQSEDSFGVAAHMCSFERCVERLNSSAQVDVVVRSCRGSE